MKRFILLTVATIFFIFQCAISSASALELSPEVRTLKANEAGESVTLSLEQVQKGKRLFNDTCAQCHAHGRTKTDPNVTLAPDSLAGATPPRDSIAALVDYMKNPTTYDGEFDISELHPSIKSADIFPEMRNLTEDDLTAIAGHILLQPKVEGERWGTGKAYF